MLNYSYNPLQNGDDYKGVLTLLDLNTSPENCINELMNNKILFKGESILVDKIIEEESQFSPFRFVKYVAGEGIGEEIYINNISYNIRLICDNILEKFPSSIINSLLNKEECNDFLSKNL